MQEVNLLMIASLTMLVHDSKGQWSQDVLKSGATCEDKYGFESCTRSSECLSRYFLECKCIPREMRDVVQDTSDGTILCLFATYSMEVGEPRCCDHYHARSFTMTRGSHKFLEALKDLNVKSPYFSGPKTKKDGGYFKNVILPSTETGTDDDYSNRFPSQKESADNIDVILPPETEIAQINTRTNNIALNHELNELEDIISEYISHMRKSDRRYKPRVNDRKMSTMSGLSDKNIKRRIIKALKASNRY